MSEPALRTAERRRSWRLALALAPFAALLIPVALHHMGDFPVYYRTTQALLSGNGPLYGPNSGVGYPMYYRYPPLFLLAFVPFALLPLKMSAVLWAVLKWLALYFLIRGLARRMDFPRTGWWWLIPLSLSAPFLIEELVGGNAQFLIFALTAAALILLRKRPWAAAAVLALAAALKVWPFFFVPYIAARRRYAVAAACMVLIVLFTILPALHFGWHGNANLLRQWTAQEWGTESVSPDLVFPSQSLFGAMQRYFTVVDYSARVDPYYRNVTIIPLPANLIRWLWVAIVVVSYGALLLMAYSRPNSDGWLEDSLAWCFLLLLEPITARLELIALLWPGMLAATLLSRRKDLPKWCRLVLYATPVACILAPLVPGSARQRFLQVLGDDFWFTLLVTVGLLGVWLAANNNNKDTAAPVLLSRQLPTTASAPELGNETKG